MTLLDCKTVMGPVRVPLYADEPAGPVIDFMREKRSGLVPVIDRDDKFVGMLSGDRLMHFMIPRAITMMRDTDRRAGYLQESREELQERLADLRNQTVGDLVDRRVKVAHLDTPLIEALMLIDSKQFVVPVIDDDGKLVGAISFFTVLHALTDAPSKEGDNETSGDAGE